MKVFFLRIVFLYFCNALFAAGAYKVSVSYDYENSHTVQGGFQANFSFADIRLFPRFSDMSGFDIKNWSLAVRPFKEWSLYTGNLYISGIFSRFVNPVFYTPGALKNFGTRQTGIIVSLPSFSSGGMKTLAALTSVRLGSFQLHAGGRLQKEGVFEQIRDFTFPFFIAAEYSFPSDTAKWRSAASLRGTVSVLAGHSVLRSKDDTGWFVSFPVFAPTSFHYGLVEFTLKNNRFELFTSNGLMEHPFGGLYFFTRNEFSLRLRYFLLNAAFSLIDGAYIGSEGSVIRQSVNAYVNPQTVFSLNAEGTIKLAAGFLVSVKYWQEAGRRPAENLNADFKGAVSLTSRFFSSSVEYRLNGCDVFDRFVPLKDSLQIIQVSALYRTSPVKPKTLVSLSLKHESAPFFYGTEQWEVKTGWFAALKGEFRILPDLKLNITGEILFKKAGNDYIASCGLVYVFYAGETKSGISADFSYEYKTSSNRTKIAAGIKYTLEVKK